MAESYNNLPRNKPRLKRDYVDESTLDARAASWLEEIRPYTRHPFSRERLGENPALLVLDMQRFFLDPESRAHLPAARAILPRVQALVQAFKDHDHPVIFTRHLDRPNDRSGAMFRWWNYLMAADHRETELHPGLHGGPREILTVKHHYNAFHETRLQVLLRQLKATSVVITGVMTHLCCESTARAAFIRGFDVIMVVDGTATMDETLHLSALRGLAHGMAAPALARQISIGLGS
jgi:bifunctional isochorismate lyase/aryl carrier protein